MSPDGVPAAPNLAEVRASVVEVRPETTEQVLVLVLQVQGAEDVPGWDNWLREEVGRRIEAKLARQGGYEPSAAEEIAVRLAFRGDEHGGGYYGNTRECQKIGQ